MRSVDYCIHDPAIPLATTTKPTFPTTVGPVKNDNDGSKPKLEIVGNNGRPTSRFPLKICQGDCDRDSEVSQQKANIQLTDCAFASTTSPLT